MKKKEDHDHLTNSSHRQTEIQIYKISSQSIIYIKILKVIHWANSSAPARKKFRGKSLLGFMMQNAKNTNTFIKKRF
jgi:hypothetical protein